MTYLNYPVFPYSIKPLNVINKKITHRRRFIGKSWQSEYYYYIEQEKYSASLSFNFENHTEMDTIRQFFIDRQGKAKLFWLPTWNNDLIPISPSLNGSKIIKLEQEFFHIYKLIKRPLVVYLPNHNFISYVTGIEEAFDVKLKKVVSKLTLKDNLPVDIYPDVCQPLQFLFLGRFQSDTITFSFIDLVRGECSADFEELSRIDYTRYTPQIIAY